MTAQFPLTGPEAIAYALGNLDLAAVEKEHRDVIAARKKTARPRAVRVLRVLSGLRRNDLQPADLMLTSVPVIPPRFRPFAVAGTTFIPGDANEMYRDLIEYRRLYKRTEDMMGREGAGGVYADMNQAVRAVFGFGESPNPKTRQRAVKGFFETIVGSSPKHSFYQSKMLSKPVDMSARGVIVPDADLGMNEVGLPMEQGWKMYGPHVQRRLVLGGMAPGAALMHLRQRSPQAEKALMAEAADRPVILTRSPAWHKFNVVSSFPKFVDGNAIRINPYITEGMNADFDGDSLDLETPLILRRNGELTVLSGRAIQAEFSISDGDEIIYQDGFEAWTYSGWSRVVNFSLHKCRRKRKFRIKLKNGVEFTVSEDHSLMVNRSEVKPENVAPGVRLDTSDLTSAVGSGGTYDEGVIFGHFMGDGCAELLHITSGRVSIACKPDIERDYLKTLWKRKYACHVTDCGYGWFQITSGAVAAELLASCGKYAAGKTVAPALMSKSREFLAGMLAGYILADGSVEFTKSGSYLVRTWSRSKDLRDRMSVVACLLGLPHALRQRFAKGEMNYLISFGKEAIKKLDYRCPGKKGELLRQAVADYATARSTVKASQSARGFEISSITEVDYGDRMIDLEVESGEHVFSVIGGVVLHNTMSVHLPVGQDAVSEARTKLLPGNMPFSIKDRTKTMGNPKHEMVIGLSPMAPASGKPSQKWFATDEEAEEAIMSGQVDLSDDIQIGTRKP